MIDFTRPLWLLLLLPAMGAAVFLWREGFLNLSLRRRRLALATRCLLLLLIVLGLAGLQVRLPQSREATVFVADLSASDEGGATAMQKLITSAATVRPGDDLAGVVTTARAPLVEQPASPLSEFDAFQSSGAIDRNWTDLESGLNLAAAVLPGGYRKRIVLMSDGQQNVGDAVTAARLLHEQGIRVDVSPIRVPGGVDARIDSVEVPAQLRPHETFPLTVSLSSNVETDGGFDVYRDRTLITSRQIHIPLGRSQIVLQEPAISPGWHTFRVHITPADDAVPENNTGTAVTSVLGPPKVLVIAGDPSNAADVMSSLRSTGMQPSVQTPADVVPTLGYLQQYAAVVIVNTAADILGPALQAQLVPYVRDLGHGLVVIGGQEAYGMGGYGGTPLEQALPVKMDLPKRKDLPSAAVALIIESLEGNFEINISKQAGKGVVQLLNQGDQIAISDAPGDGTDGWVVPLQHARDKGWIENQINAMQPGDPMSYAQYLQAAYDVLKGTHARIKHIILLGDGDAEDPSYADLAKKIREGGVTISTIATNGLGMSDFATMRRIASNGGGRFYQADNTSAVPKIFLREARTVARSGIIEGKFYPQELSANPMVRDLRSVPPLYGYVATTPKPAGEIVLASTKLDPVLAGWQFGLGRAVAWTSDAAGQWTRDWLQAPGANRFWANLVSWTLPARSGGNLFVSASAGEGNGRISVDTPADVGPSPDVTAHVVGPDLQPVSIRLQPSAPHHYAAAFPAHAEGGYVITVEARGAGHAEAGEAGLDVPYSAEYRTSGTNMSLLQQVAMAGGGSMIRDPSAAWADNLAAVLDRRDLADLLWLLALLLLPVDIAIRRLVVTRRDLLAIREALPFFRPAHLAPEPIAPALGTIRQGRQQRRVSVPRPTASAVHLSGGAPAASVTTAAKSPPAPARAAAQDSPQDVPDDTSSRLLAAKKRHR